MIYKPDRAKAPEIHSLPIKPLPWPERIKYANGIDGVLVQDEAQPVSRITLFWPVGYADVADNNTLLMLRQLLTEGTSSHTGAEIAEILEFHGAWIKTDYGRHNILVDIYILNKTADVVLPMLSEIVMQPTFPEEALQRTRQTAIAKIKTADKKVKNQVIRLSNSQLFGKNAPASKRATEEGLLSVTREDIIKLHKQLLLSTPPTIFAAGCIDRNIKKHLEALALKFQPNPLYSIERHVCPAIPITENIRNIFAMHCKRHCASPFPLSQSTTPISIHYRLPYLHWEVISGAV